MYVAPILTHKADKKLALSLTEGMGLPSSQRERFITPLESLARIAKLPQSPGFVCDANHSGINRAIAEDERPMAIRIIHAGCVFEMFLDGNEFAHPVRHHCRRHMR